MNLVILCFRYIALRINQMFNVNSSEILWAQRTLPAYIDRHCWCLFFHTCCTSIYLLNKISKHKHLYIYIYIETHVMHKTDLIQTWMASAHRDWMNTCGNRGIRLIWHYSQHSAHFSLFTIHTFYIFTHFQFVYTHVARVLIPFCCVCVLCFVFYSFSFWFYFTLLFQCTWFYFYLHSPFLTLSLSALTLSCCFFVILLPNAASKKSNHFLVCRWIF